jgi:hypothetical protein
MEYEPSQLSDIDAVELIDLKGLQSSSAREYMKIAKDAPTVHVQGEVAQQIAHLWRQLPTGQEARCHIPPFGLRFYRRNELLVQGSVCWGCNNIFGEESGESFAYAFDGQHAYSQLLFALLENILENILDQSLWAHPTFAKTLAEVSRNSPRSLF